MPGLVPGIHVFRGSSKKDVDGRVEPGHDEKRESYSSGSSEPEKCWMHFQSGSQDEVRAFSNYTAISADWMRLTPALAMSAQALASEPWVSMPRQPSSTT